MEKKVISVEEMKRILKRNPRLKQFLPHELYQFGSRKEYRFANVDFFDVYFNSSGKFGLKEKFDPKTLEDLTTGKAIDIPQDVYEEEYEEVEVSVVDERPAKAFKQDHLDLSFATEVLQGSKDPQLQALYQQRMEEMQRKSKRV